MDGRNEVESQESRVKSQESRVKSRESRVKSQEHFKKNTVERNFENLRVWQEARIFVNDIYQMMSDCHDYGFRDQIQRAAVSIMNNIAEGSESGSDAKFINYLYISKGSCSEVRNMLYLCEDFKICTLEEREELYRKAQSISGSLSKLIKYLEEKR